MKTFVSFSFSCSCGVPFSRCSGTESGAGVCKCLCSAGSFVDANGVMLLLPDLGRGEPVGLVMHGGPGASHEVLPALSSASGSAQPRRLYR